jgi:hypothetical protein
MRLQNDLIEEYKNLVRSGEIRREEKSLTQYLKENGA